ncbi:MAG: BatA domain-containing protein [Thermoguttaceae bacterium]|nr:BatA domain-containing protein [Thermoguttaceae bacterium]
MSLMNFSFFLAGCLAVVIPILLHLLMRGRPKKVLFPALAFLARRHARARRSLTLKHLLLLALRCGLCVLLGLALARPFLRPRASDGPLLTGGPAAVAIVVDTSIRMGTMAENSARLAKAQEAAHRILSSLPAGSRAAILDNLGENDTFRADLLAAGQAVDELSCGASPRSAAASAAAGIRLLKELKYLDGAERFDRQLIVLTDRCAQSWPPQDQQKIKRALDAPGPSAALRWADFSSEVLVNGSIRSAVLTDTSDGPRLDLTIAHVGQPLRGTVEYWLVRPNAPSPDETPAGEAQNNETQAGETQLDETRCAAAAFPPQWGLPPSLGHLERKLSAPVTFEQSDTPQERELKLYPPKLTGGAVLGFVRLLPEDPFLADNIRWFALRRSESPKILLAASAPEEEKALFVRLALETASPSYDLEVCGVEQLAARRADALSSYSAIFLLDPPPLAEDLWKTLLARVEAGTGVGLFFGRSWRPSENVSESQKRLLGGALSGPVRHKTPVYPVPGSESSPIIAELRPLQAAAAVPWDDLPVYKYWKYTPDKERGKESAAVTETPLLYSDGAAAILCRSIGEGTLLITTTPLSESGHRPDAWNHLTTGESSWVFLMLLDAAARSLLSGGGETLLCAPGQTAVLRPKPPIPEHLLLMFPDGEQTALSPEPDGRQVRVSRTFLAGPYLLRSEKDGPDGPVLSSACVNPLPEEFDLTACDPDQIESFFAPAKIEPLDLSDSFFDPAGRASGREFYPLMIILLGLFLLAEEWVANRFYRR